jgi:hypothetical protein
VVKRHFSGKPNASQFTVAQDELRGILQSEEFVKTPITRTLQSTEGTLYVREVDYKQLLTSFMTRAGSNNQMVFVSLRPLQP